MAETSAQERVENAEDILQEILGEEHAEKIKKTYIPGRSGITVALMHVGVGKLMELIAHNTLTTEALITTIVRCDNDPEFRHEVAAVALFATLRIYDEGVTNHLRR